MDLNFELLKRLYADFLEIIPVIIGVIIYIITGYIALKLTVYFVKRLLKISKIECLKDKINEMISVENASFEINLEKIILTFVHWVLVLILIVIGADMFSLNSISSFTGNLLTYLPQLLTAVIILIIGFYVSALIKNTLRKMLTSLNLNGSKAISMIVFYIMIVFVSITALNQAGIETELITNNISLILGIILGAFALALGLGSRDIVHRLVLGYYSKMNFHVGDRVKIDNSIGTIISIDNISLVLKTEEGKIVFPIKQVNNQKIEILND